MTWTLIQTAKGLIHPVRFNPHCTSKVVFRRKHTNELVLIRLRYDYLASFGVVSFGEVSTWRRSALNLGLIKNTNAFGNVENNSAQ